MDEDQEICRVCRSESTPDHPLYHPCKCSGSIRFVHEDCLIEWLSHSKKKYCELCEHPFTFTPIYRDDMPDRVPFYVLVDQFVKRSTSFVKIVLRAIAVIFVWLMLLPSFTLWTWRFYFWSGENIGFQSAVKNETTVLETSENESLLMNYIKSFLKDCFEGQIITAFVIIIFVAAYLFREWVMQNLPEAEENLPPAQPQAQAPVRNDNEQILPEQQLALDTLMNAMQVLNLQNDEQPQLNRQMNNLRADLDNAIRERNNGDNPLDQEWVNTTLLNNLREQDDDELFNGIGNYHHEADMDLIPSDDEHEDHEDWNRARRRFDEWNNRLEDVVDEREQFLNEQFERINQELERDEQRRQQQADLDEPINVGDDMNGILEAIGMRGNPWLLIQNSVIMSLMISLCLGIAIWIPYVIGRLVILCNPMAFIKTPIYFMRLITDPLVDFVLDLCIPYIWSNIEPIIPQQLQALFVSQPEANTNQNNETMVWVEATIQKVGALALERWHGFATGRTGLDRGMCVVVGYLVLIGLASWYFSSRPIQRRRRQQSIGEMVRDIILQQGIFLKVLFFIVIELIIFPTVCGFLLDLSTLPLFEDASWKTRYEFHLNSTYISYFVHWCIGTGTLFYFANFITVCREIIRPGVMWFIRDPNDANFHPVQEMVEKPLPTLLYKISQSALIYSVMLVFGVGSVTYSLGYAGFVFPLNLNTTDTMIIVMNGLMARYLLPPLIMYLDPRQSAKKALGIWWRVASRQLRLTQFMFNERRVEEEGRHVPKTLKAFLICKKARVSEEDIDISADEDVVFKRDGMMVRVPKYDSVPVDPKRRMIVPVDPVTHEAIDEQERIRGHPAAADTVDESQATIVVYVPPFFKQRLIAFMLYMWFAISAFVCSLTVVPLLFGRLLFSLFVGRVNDLYAFTLGVYLLTGVVLVSYWCQQVQLMTSNQQEYIKEKANMVFKWLYLGSMFGFVMPTLFGLIVDLFLFMPFRDDLVVDDYIRKIWSLGIVYMSILQRVIQTLPANNRIRQEINRLTEENITRRMIVPVISVAFVVICLPLIISWGLVEFRGSKEDAYMFIRYSYPGIFGMFIIVSICYVMKKLFNIWMQTVRDDTYLIGKRLHNLQASSENEQ